LTNPASPPEPRQLALATVGAALVAALVLVTAVLPAEYGIDPTGIGRLTGFARLSEAATAPSPEVEVEDDGIRTLHAVDAAWRVQTFPVATQEGFTSATAGQTRVTFPLTVTNLSAVVATLEWNDTDLIDGQRTRPDLFELSIDGPQGRESQLVQAENGPDGRGTITVTLPWRSVPAPARAERGLLLPVHEPDDSSHGNWTFTVRLYAARGLPNHTAQDPGNSWTLTITAQAYELVLKESEGFSGDRVSLTLRPDQGVEYKFHMQPDATIRYRWESSAPIYWDLHAEEDGKDHEDFTRFEEGTGAGESGTLTASFPGRHGWYFLNRGDAPVTITLETSGDYTIVGTV
jgi:hypothetical protein